MLLIDKSAALHLLSYRPLVRLHIHVVHVRSLPLLCERLTKPLLFYFVNILHTNNLHVSILEDAEC